MSRLATQCALVALLAGLVASACGTGSPIDTGGDPTPQGPAPQMQSGLPTAFDVVKYSTYESAEAAVGYRIVRAPGYTLQWGIIFVQPIAQSGQRKVSEIFALPDGHYIYVDMFPGVSVPATAPLVQFADRKLALVDHDGSFRQFMFPCGQLDKAAISCSIKVTGVSDEQISAFVRALT